MIFQELRRMRNLQWKRKRQMAVAAQASLEWCLVTIACLALDAKLGCALEKQERALMSYMYIVLQPWLPHADSLLPKIYERKLQEDCTMLTLKNPGGLGSSSKQFCFVYYQSELEMVLFKDQRSSDCQGSRTEKVACSLRLNRIKTSFFLSKSPLLLYSKEKISESRV